MSSTTVQVDEATLEQARRISAELGVSLAETIGMAIRSLRQARGGRQLAETPLRDDETAWLDADLG